MLLWNYLDKEANEKKVKKQNCENPRSSCKVKCNFVKIWKNHIFAPDMSNNWYKYILTVILLMFYLNRGLFVAMPGIEISNPSGSEINSLLEIIINWAGGQNHLDEDGDCPESYNVAKIIQPLIDQNLMCVCLTCPYIPIHKIFYIYNEAMPSLDTYGTIDHPPEMA
jgi:hypothetical protein